MVYYRPRRRLAKKRKQMRKPMRKLRNIRPRIRPQVFSETFAAADMRVVSDGISSSVSAQPFAASIASTSQFKNYQALYQKYRILALKWTIIPRFGGAEPNQAEYNVGASGTFQANGLVHIVKDWTGENSPLPSDEITMLQHQGVKTRLLNGRPFTVSMKYPTTLKGYEINDLSGGVPTTFISDNVTNNWCSFDDPVQYNHGNLLTYAVVSPGGNLQTIGSSCAKVYCKVTFAVAEPR